MTHFDKENKALIARKARIVRSIKWRGRNKRGSPGMPTTLGLIVWETTNKNVSGRRVL